MAINLVELAASDGDCGFDQRCRFGHRVEDHAVYCHNDNWTDSPRKCRRSWYTGGRIKDEDCAGFEANPQFSGELVPTPISEPLCHKCNGKKLIKTDRGKMETCPLCVGSGSEPEPIVLTPFEQDILESGTRLSGSKDTGGHSFIAIADSAAESDSILKLDQLSLVEIRSVTFGKVGCAYLLENSMKGEAVMRKNWETRKKGVM